MAPDTHNENAVLDLIAREAWDQVAAILTQWHPADIADLIEHAPADDHARLFDLLGDELKPNVLAELEADAEDDVLEELSDDELADVVEEMAPDDAADVLNELPGERSQSVLELMEADEREDVRKLLAYDEESAGGIMTTDVLAMAETDTVAEALRAIADFETGGKFHYANIVDGQGVMIGYIDIWELLRERDQERKLGDMANRDFTAAEVEMDQEAVAELAVRYNLGVIPVVDSRGRLVGRITADDVMDVIEEEASEDIFKMAGSDDMELEGASVLRSCYARLPWLFVTLLGSVVTSMILRQFHAYLAGLMALAAFVPAVLAMGGNTGIQSSTLVVRSLALGTIHRRRVGSILMREILTGALMGVVCGVVIGLVARFLVLGRSAAELPLPPAGLGAVVALALFSAMTFAAVFGAIVPLVLDRLRIDPAMASGPFVTITNDVSALLIYFGVTILMVSRFL